MPMSGEFANDRLAETEFLQRMPHTVLSGGNQARSIIAEIIDIGAAANDLETHFIAKGGDPFVQFALAMIATAAVVAGIVGVSEFVCADNKVTDADLVCDSA